MMKSEACLPLVNEFFDGELEPRLARDLRAHMAGCRSCSGHYESLRLGQDIYDKFLEDVRLSSTAWRAVHRKIQETKTADRRGLLSGLFEKRNWLLLPRFQQAVVAVILGIVLIGIVALRFTARPEDKQQVATADPTRVESQAPVSPAVTSPLSTEQPRPGNAASELKKRDVPVPRIDGFARAKASDVRPPATSQLPMTAMLAKAVAFNRAMDSARSAFEVNGPVTLKTDVARHFEKTRLLLLSMKNTPISESDAGVNVSYEKTLSRKLANSNLLLRREMTLAGDQPAAELLDRIEPLLLELANMPERVSSEEVALISRRIARRDVIALLQSQSF